MLLVDIAFKNKVGIFQINTLVEDEEWYNLVRDPFIKISYVRRNFLKVANALAKEGKAREEVISIWCLLLGFKIKLSPSYFL